jgi:hypothetical protein
MKYPLHPACACWPEMSPKDLAELADDIAANGLREAITVTPAGELLDGRNRALASEMAGVEIPDDKIVVYDGDPWLFSISKNARRRHMTTEAIALVVAAMPMKQVGANRFSVGPSNEGPSATEAAEAAGIPKTGRRFYYLALSYGYVRPDMGATDEARKEREAAYKKVTEVLGVLRMNGDLGWDAVLDLTRELDEWLAYGSPREAREAMRRIYDEDR